MRAYAAAGADGIGVWELKLEDDNAALELLEESGLGRASAVPAIPSILPLPLMDGPEDPQARIDAICASVHRLAAFRPSGVVCLTGPGEDRDTVVEGLRALDAAGWDGYYDVEIFSDNGSFGNAWPDSIWDTPAEQLAREAKEAFTRVWEARIQSPVDQVSPGAV